MSCCNPSFSPTYLITRNHSTKSCSRHFVWSRHFFKKITFILFIFFIIPPGNPRSTGQEEKMKLFIWLFWRTFLLLGVLVLAVKEVSTTTHIHTDIPKCVRGPPEEGGCLLKKASPLLFSYPLHHHQHFTQLAWCVVQQRALHFLLLGKREESR